MIFHRNRIIIKQVLHLEQPALDCLLGSNSPRLSNLFFPKKKICLFLKVTNPHTHERPAKPMAFPKRLKIALKKKVACRE
jgi:hypothetical protein